MKRIQGVQMHRHKLFRDKKGIEKIMSLWWIVSWVLIALGVIVIMGMVTSKTVEVREVQSEVIAKRIVSCFPEAFSLIYSDEINQFYDFCYIDKDRKENFALRVEINPKDETKSELLKRVTLGNQNFFLQCDIAMAVTRAQHYPLCSKQSFVSEFDGTLFEVNVLVASNEIGGRFFTK
jgi:hypothetical protein